MHLVQRIQRPGWKDELNQADVSVVTGFLVSLGSFLEPLHYLLSHAFQPVFTVVLIYTKSNTHGLGLLTLFIAKHAGFFYIFFMLESFYFHISRIYDEPYVVQSTTLELTFWHLRWPKAKKLKYHINLKRKYGTLTNTFYFRITFINFKINYVDKVDTDLPKNLGFTRKSYRGGFSQTCWVFNMTYFSDSLALQWRVKKLRAISRQNELYISRGCLCLPMGLEKDLLPDDNNISLTENG